MTKQSKCSWCGRKRDACERNNCVSHQVKKELAEWIGQHGVRWRAALREHWLHDGDELRYLRNAVGPTGIATIRPTKKQRDQMTSCSKQLERGSRSNRRLRAGRHSPSL